MPQSNARRHIDYTVLYRQTGGEPYALKGARTVRRGVHLPWGASQPISMQRLTQGGSLPYYGGAIYIDRSTNSFKWYISSKENILGLIEYFKKYPSRSLKKNRLHLIPRCYELKDIGAHKASCPPPQRGGGKEKNPFLAKSWKLFLDKWNKYEA